MFEVDALGKDVVRERISHLTKEKAEAQASRQQEINALAKEVYRLQEENGEFRRSNQGLISDLSFQKQQNASSAIAMWDLQQDCERRGVENRQLKEENKQLHKGTLVPGATLQELEGLRQENKRRVSENEKLAQENRSLKIKIGAFKKILLSQFKDIRECLALIEERAGGWLP
jgi:hypothetical protein